MEPIPLKKIVEVVDGKVNKNLEKIIDSTFIFNISIDSRNIFQNSLFIPIIGKNFDGHDFIDNAIKNGAICCLSERNVNTDKLIILVKNTKIALGKIAKFYRNMFKIKVIAITGSVGKTTTKDLIYSVLSQKYNVVKTEGNFNNDIGLPLTIFNLKKDTQILVLEMGMNHFNEIHNLSNIACPDIAVITNIGLSHIENLGSREGILKAKLEIFDFLNPSSGIKILNKVDDLLKDVKNIDLKRTFFYSVNNKADVFVTKIIKNDINEILAEINCFGEIFEINIKVAGIHTLSNALVAVMLGNIFKLNIKQIKQGIQYFKPSKMRMDIIKTDKYTIINDIYNSNPISVKALIDTLSNVKTRKVAILGDMLELGKQGAQLHYEVGEYVIIKNIDLIICIGDLSKNIFFGAKNTIEKLNLNTKAIFYENQDEFLEHENNLLNINDTILIKASRGMKFEKTLDKIKR